VRYNDVKINLDFKLFLKPAADGSYVRRHKVLLLLL
jgi:hypothetical protein